jgi:hypothetical protein
MRPFLKARRQSAGASWVFGYVRPVKGELKVREFELFKACYCGLCHSLGRHYGAVSRLVLNFDFVFLAMLIWEGADAPEFEYKRCPASPLVKKRCCAPSGALDRCAGYSVILAYWKLRDNMGDETFFKRLAAGVAALFLLGPYRKARRLYGAFDGSVRVALGELAGIEASNTAGASLDGAADKFAHILCSAAEAAPDGRRRALEQLLYHTGRWIYIADACDDIAPDAKRGRYNPVASLFGSETAGTLDGGQKERMRLTLAHSANLAGAAFELMDETAWAPIIRNILSQGMPCVCTAVLSGNFVRRRNRHC